MPPYNQEMEERTNTKDIAQLETIIQSLAKEVRTLTSTLETYIAAQTVRCNNATYLLARHETTLMGDGDTRQGLGSKVSTNSLQIKLILGVLSAVSLTTLGLTANLLLKAL